MSYDYYNARERTRRRKMRRQIRSIISMGITIIVLISILIIGSVVAKQAMGPTPDITPPTPVSSTNTYYFD